MQELTNKQYNEYLRKYEDTYQTYRNDDNVYVIKTKHGNIQPFSVDCKFLCFYGNLLSRSKKTWLIKKLPTYCLVTQEADTEVVFKFPENQLIWLSKMLKITKKRKLTDEQRTKLAEQFKRNMAKRGAVNK